MSRYICDGCGSDIENPVNISEPMPTIFSNLMVVTSDTECPKCKELENQSE